MILLRITVIVVSILIHHKKCLKEYLLTLILVYFYFEQILFWNNIIFVQNMVWNIDYMWFQKIISYCFVTSNKLYSKEIFVVLNILQIEIRKFLFLYYSHGV